MKMHEVDHRPKDGGPNQLTVVVPFYGEEERFKLQHTNWCGWSRHVKDQVKVIVVDDCGKKPIANMLTPNRLKYTDFDLKVYRIKDDVRWNTPGALNLGITQATTHWVWIMDSDCLVTDEMMRKVLTYDLSEDVTYWFSRQRVTNNPSQDWVTRYLGCCILFNKDQVAKSGLFDEDLSGGNSGGYGMFDWEFAERLGLFFKRNVIRGIKVTEYMEDQVGANVQTLERVRNKHHHKNKQVIAKKGQPAERLGKQGAILRFNWELAWST